MPTVRPSKGRKVMSLWTSIINNRMYLQAEFELEKTKADLVRLNMELIRTDSNRLNSLENASLIEASLNYVCLYSKIVSLNEFSKLKGQLASEYHAAVASSNLLSAGTKQVKVLKHKIEHLERSLLGLSSVVLRFPAHD